MTNKEETVATRDIANGIKLALKELGEDEPETLRRFLMAVFEHLGDGATKWAGRKFFTGVAVALFAASLWLMSRKW
jgi:hypothetical protein